MEENNVLNKISETFDELDENELAIVLTQVARRMSVLRCTTPDMLFWHSVIMRVNKWLSTEPVLNHVEKEFLLSPPANTSGRLRAMRSMRDRSGMQINACKEVIDAWIKINIELVHDSVRASYFCNENNRKAHGLS